MDSALPAVFTSQFRFNRAVGGFIGPSGYALFFRQVTLFDIQLHRYPPAAPGRMSIRYLVPDPVRKYIGDHPLHASDSLGSSVLMRIHYLQHVPSKTLARSDPGREGDVTAQRDPPPQKREPSANGCLRPG